MCCGWDEEGVGGGPHKAGVRVSNQVSSGKGNIKNMSLSFHTFYTTFKTNDKKRDWISFFFIRNKNDHQVKSGKIWRGGEGGGGGGGVRRVKWFIFFIYSDKETKSVSVQENS